MAELTLILGGARSGKSSYGERLAQSLGSDVLFVATAQPFDEEMAARIERHRQSRPSYWHTLEAPKNIGVVLGGESAAVVLLDCITLLVSNVLLEMGDELEETVAQTAVDAELDALLEKLAAWEGHWIVISNEVGLGIVPENRLARIYRDVLGRVNQRLAAAASKVILLAAGLPLIIKDN